MEYTVMVTLVYQHATLVFGDTYDKRLQRYHYVKTTLHSRYHGDVMKWKHFPRYWPFTRGIHRSPVNSPHKGQWRGALMFALICAWINGWVNNPEAGDLRRYDTHYDVTVMIIPPGVYTGGTADFIYSVSCGVMWWGEGDSSGKTRYRTMHKSFLW